MTSMGVSIRLDVRVSQGWRIAASSGQRVWW